MASLNKAAFWYLFASSLAYSAPFIGMHPVNEYLIDLVHHGIDFFGTEFVGKRSEAFHIAEHHRDLSLLSFNLVPLGEDLLRDVNGKVFPYLLYLFFRGEVLGKKYGRED